MNQMSAMLLTLSHTLSTRADEGAPSSDSDSLTNSFIPCQVIQLMPPPKAKAPGLCPGLLSCCRCR